MPKTEAAVPQREDRAAAGPPRISSRAFALYAWAVLAYNVAVILWGAVVRATGSGAGCGDHWPLCNGVVTPLAPSLHTLIEFTHRVMSGLDVALVAVLAIWAFRAFPRGHAVRVGAALSGLFLVTEALLGAGLVLLKHVAQNADAWWNSIHLVNTLTLVAVLALTAWWATGHAAARLRGRAAWMAVISLGSFVLLAVSGAIAALGDTLFPARSLAEGFAQDFNPTAHLFLRLRIWHPAMAALVGAWLVYFALSVASSGEASRKLSHALIFLLAAQMAAGALNLLLLAPVWLQLLHLLLADLLWVATVLLAAESLKAAPSLRR
jgi:heme A synthase